MTPAELTVCDLAIFARFAENSAEAEMLSDEEKAEIEMALEAAKHMAEASTGLSLPDNPLPDLAYAILVLGAEMLDNRQYSVQHAIKNPLVEQIFALHNHTLIPGLPHERYCHG